jgi:hypothetical protein
MSTLTARRPAYAVGTRVQRHPDTNPGMDERMANDRGTVLDSRASEEMPHLDIVTVLWDSVRYNLTERQLDEPCSKHADFVASTRLRRSSVQ